MDHQADLSSHVKALKKIKIQFTRFRITGGGRYPPHLKAMTISAASDGLSKSSIARAAGIAPSMIYYWLASAPRVKRLKVVETSPFRGVELEVMPNKLLVCIRLASGVEIDLPRSELSGELLATLNAISGGRQ